MKKCYGEELMDFVQLTDGHWAGYNLTGTYVTGQQYTQGERPVRFKYEPFVKANGAQTKEYWAKIKALQV